MFKHCNAGLSRKGIWLKFLFYRKGTGIKQLNSSFMGREREWNFLMGRERNGNLNLIFTGMAGNGNGNYMKKRIGSIQDFI